jgi:hypothetical protein
MKFDELDEKMRVYETALKGSADLIYAHISLFPSPMFLSLLPQWPNR